MTYCMLRMLNRPIQFTSYIQLPNEPRQTWFHLFLHGRTPGSSSLLGPILMLPRDCCIAEFRCLLSFSKLDRILEIHHQPTSGIRLKNSSPKHFDRSLWYTGKYDRTLTHVKLHTTLSWFEDPQLAIIGIANNVCSSPI